MIEAAVVVVMAANIGLLPRTPVRVATHYGTEEPSVARRSPSPAPIGIFSSSPPRPLLTLFRGGCAGPVKPFFRFLPNEPLPYSWKRSTNLRPYSVYEDVKVLHRCVILFASSVRKIPTCQQQKSVLPWSPVLITIFPFFLPNTS